MTTEIDFDGQSVELFRRLRRPVRFECAEPIRQKTDGSEDPSLQPVRVLGAVLSNATVVSDSHSKLQIKSGTKESATALPHGNRVHVERQMNVVRLLQKQFGEMKSTVPDSPHGLVSEGGRKLGSFRYSGDEIAA